MGSGKVWATGRELLSKHQHLLRVTLENKAANWLVVSAAMARGNTTHNPHPEIRTTHGPPATTSNQFNTERERDGYRQGERDGAKEILLTAGNGNVPGPGDAIEMAVARTKAWPLTSL